jgi:hypothetical protein
VLAGKRRKQQSRETGGRKNSMAIKIEIIGYGKRFKITNNLGEVAYLTFIPKLGDVLHVTGPNGPVNRMVTKIEKWN